MTREEAIKICSREKEFVQAHLNACADGEGYVSPDGVIRAADYVEAMSMAIAALREQEERSKNESLTLDELRGMKGEPVYCPDYEHWGTVEIDETGPWKGQPFFAGSWKGIWFNYNIEQRNLNLYRHKPDGQKLGKEG